MDVSSGTNISKLSVSQELVRFESWITFPNAEVFSKILILFCVDGDKPYANEEFKTLDWCTKPFPILPFFGKFLLRWELFAFFSHRLYVCEQVFSSKWISLWNQNVLFIYMYRWSVSLYFEKLTEEIVFKKCSFWCSKYHQRWWFLFCSCLLDKIQLDNIISLNSVWISFRHPLHDEIICLFSLSDKLYNVL